MAGSMIALAAAALLCIASVHDGDSLRTCNGDRVRLAGVDAPDFESSPRCRDPRRRAKAWCAGDAAAARARDAFIAELRRGPAACVDRGRDAYRRRLCTILVDHRDVGAALLARGLARPWP